MQYSTDVFLCAILTGSQKCNKTAIELSFCSCANALTYSRSELVLIVTQRMRSLNTWHFHIMIPFLFLILYPYWNCFISIKVELIRNSVCHRDSCNTDTVTVCQEFFWFELKYVNLRLKVMRFETQWWWQGYFNDKLSDSRTVTALSNDHIKHWFTARFIF